MSLCCDSVIFSIKDFISNDQCERIEVVLQILFDILTFACLLFKLHATNLAEGIGLGVGEFWYLLGINLEDTIITLNSHVYLPKTFTVVSPQS